MKKSDYAALRFILLLSLFFAFYFNAEGAKEKRLLLIVPAVTNNTPSPEFFAVIHSAVPYYYKLKNSSGIEILSDDTLAEQYAKIILHSYGLNNRQISILKSIHSFSQGGISNFDVCGVLSLKDKYYLQQDHVEWQTVRVLNDEKPVTDIRKNTGYVNTAVIVLGTAPLDETTPTLDMVRRVEAGIKILKKNPNAMLIFSGGKTGGPISEARMMALIAYARGILPSQVILEEDSLSTIENAQFVDRIVKKVPVKRFILVSRPTHLKRAVPIFGKYPEFRDIQAVASPISKQEIKDNFEEYLAFKDSERVRQVLRKILKEFYDAGF